MTKIYPNFFKKSLSAFDSRWADWAENLHVRHLALHSVKNADLKK